MTPGAIQNPPLHLEPLASEVVTAVETSSRAPAARRECETEEINLLKKCAPQDSGQKRSYQLDAHPQYAGSQLHGCTDEIYCNECSSINSEGPNKKRAPVWTEEKASIFQEQVILHSHGDWVNWAAVSQHPKLLGLLPKLSCTRSSGALPTVIDKSVPSPPTPTPTRYHHRMQRTFLAHKDDGQTLNPYHRYLRTYMIELFEAGSKDIEHKRKTGGHEITYGQIGIRCRWCSHPTCRCFRYCSVFYPPSVDMILPLVLDLQKIHIRECRCLPDDVRARVTELRATYPPPFDSSMYKPEVKSHWTKTAHAIGLVDTDGGLRFDSSQVEK